MKTVLQVLLTLFSLTVTLLIGWSRIVDNKHHPSDVLSGWIIGAAVAIGIVRTGLAVMDKDFLVPTFFDHIICSLVNYNGQRHYSIQVS